MKSGCSGDAAVTLEVTLQAVVRRIRLIHWNAQEAGARAAPLRAAGYQVVAGPIGPDGLRAMRADPPDAVVVDLTRLPSQGRDVALVVRQQKATRGVPLVFVDGDPTKVALVRRLLPDAAYTSWPRVRAALGRAIARPPAEPAVPGSVLAGYSGTPLPKKLGIKPGSVVALVGAPKGFASTLGELPPGAQLRHRAGAADVTVWFVRSRRDLARGIRRMTPAAEGGGLWIAWPKKASKVETDLSERVVRETGLAAHLMDFKICAIDATWSGLRFTRPRAR